MKKAERNHLNRKQNAERLLREIDAFFRNNPERNHVKRVVSYESQDFDILTNSRFPLLVLTNADSPVICFKRSAAVTDPELHELDRLIPHWR